jgi:glycosyltransferase involved in cell wall biosynthesis
MAACDILLASYNSARYGPALLESLLGQTDQSFRLLVRDDGSTDGSMDMLRAYQPRFEGRMEVIEDTTPTGSALGNFSILIDNADADYVLFADIDDVWLPTKVADTLSLLRNAELNAPPGTPIYAFTDVIPVDAALVPKGDSYWVMKKIDPAVGTRLNQSLVCPVMLGCASGVNRALINLGRPVPGIVTGHDWWLQLVAAAFGHVVYSPERTLLYRLHGANASAQMRVNFLDYLGGQNRIAKVRRGMLRRREQAQALSDHFGDQLPREASKAVAQFVATGRQGFLKRRLTILEGGFLYADMPRNLAMLIGM